MSEHAILRIHASSTDRIEKLLFHEFLVQYAREYGMSGATVYRGIMGYGSSNRIASSRFWELTEKLPVLIEIIDTRLRLEQFYSDIEDELLKMKKGCMVTLEPTHILLKKKGEGR